MQPSDSNEQNSASPLAFNEVVAFNAQLRNIAEAGIPIQLSPLDDRDDLRARLTAVESRLALAQSRGVTIEQSIAIEPMVTDQYRKSLMNWVASDGDPESIEPLLQNAVWRKNAESQISFSLVQPLIIVTLIYVAYLFLLRSIVPHLEAIYSQIRESSGPSLGLLRAMLDAMPYWSVAVPVVIVLVIALRWFIARRSMGPWMPGYTSMVRSVQIANDADALAQGLIHGVRPEHLSDARGTAPEGAANSESIVWALDRGKNDQQRAALLKFVGELHRGRINKYESRWGRWIPIVMGSILSGLLVLGFSISLFRPMIELLWTVAKP